MKSIAKASRGYPWKFKYEINILGPTKGTCGNSDMKSTYRANRGYPWNFNYEINIVGPTKGTCGNSNMKSTYRPNTLNFNVNLFHTDTKCAKVPT